MASKAAKRRQSRVRWEQRRQKRLKRRASQKVVVVESYGHGRPYRFVGSGSMRARVRKAGGPKRTTIRAHK